MVVTQGFFVLLVIIGLVEGKASYVHGYLPARYYQNYPTSRTYTDDNVYITDKYGQVVSVEPSWSRSSKSYDSTPYYNKRCYNCIAYDPYPYSRRVYVKDRFGNSVLVNPSYLNDVYGSYYPTYRNSRYYSSGRKNYDHEDYVYVNDMYGRTRAVPKANYLYEYAKRY